MGLRQNIGADVLVFSSVKYKFLWLSIVINYWTSIRLQIYREVISKKLQNYQSLEVNILGV